MNDFVSVCIYLKNFELLCMKICCYLQDIVSANAMLEEVKQSGKFSKMIELILLMGNFMNAGSRNEMTIGFELSFISKARINTFI